MLFQTIISKLHGFWADQGCVICHPYDLEKGAATLSPNTFLKSLGVEPWSIAYVEPCRRPIDSRYAKNGGDRYQWYYQYQVLIKPAVVDPKKIFLKSLSDLGVSSDKYDIKFIDDVSESPVFGAKFRGWEVLLNGVEIAQVSYLDQVGGIDCDPVPLEIAYGLERIALQIQGVKSFHEIKWNDNVTYGDLYRQQEVEQSFYNFETSRSSLVKKLLILYIEEVENQLGERLVYPSLDYLLKCSHAYNLLESRGEVSKKELIVFVKKIRSLSNRVGKLYLNKKF